MSMVNLEGGFGMNKTSAVWSRDPLPKHMWLATNRLRWAVEPGRPPRLQQWFQDFDANVDEWRDVPIVNIEASAPPQVPPLTARSIRFSSPSWIRDFNS